MSSGLGLAGFLGHGNRGDAGGWLHNDWKKRGHVDTWLHTQADIYPCWQHRFIFEEVTEEDDGKVVRKLRYPRFLSPEPEIVLSGQYFRQKKKDLTTPLEKVPTEDVFLLLREWLLLHRTDLSENTVIFEWWDHDAREKVQWLKGQLTGEMERGKRTRGHTLNAAMEYLFTIADNDDLTTGVMLARATKSLGDAIKKVIGDERKSKGDDEGNPLHSPYCIRWEYNAAAKRAQDYYAALRYDRVEYNNAVFQVITGTDFPDGSQHASPRDGDLVKIRAYFEAAAKIKLPLDALFSDDIDVRTSLALRPTSAPPRRAQSSGGGGSNGVKPPPRSGARTSAPSQAPSGSRSRRRVAAPAPAPAPEPAPEPEEELLPCDNCGKDMPATATKCDNCGQVYQFDDQAPDASPPAPDASASQPQPEPQADSRPASQPDPGAVSCVMCNGGPVVDGTCKGCGMDQGDDIPF